MKIQYFFPSQKGDIPLGPSELARPFKITPSEVHATLTLGDYFGAIVTFLFTDDGKRLYTLLEKELGPPLGPEKILKVRIFSEKHGAFSHIARAEIDGDVGSLALAVSTAVTPEARAHLNREYETLRTLERAFAFAFLPKVFYRGDVRMQTPKGEAGLSFFLAQWFEDYHEWHLHPDPAGKGSRICIWDQNRGRRIATRRETREIFRQASRILTLYYDPKNYCQIHPWHHAAGDFIVRTRNGAVDVKLSTARNYAPVMTFLHDRALNPSIAVVYFFLNLTVQMRLDKQEGTGETLWADNEALKAAVRGFFDGLRRMEGRRGYALGPAEDLLALLKSFDAEEILRLYRPLRDHYREVMPEDCSVVRENLERHGHALFRIIQSFRIEDRPGGC